MTDRMTVACVATFSANCEFSCGRVRQFGCPVSCRNHFLAKVCAGPLLNFKKQSAASTYRLTAWMYGSNDLSDSIMAVNDSWKGIVDTEN